MHDEIVGLLVKVDAAISQSAGVVDDAELEPLVRFRDNVEDRVAHPEDVVFVALAGGTGSGKSSLLNAIANEELVDTGGIRPTTSEPLGVISSLGPPAAAGYLHELGIETLQTSSIPPWLSLVDLPDSDSVVVEHRHTVERILPLVDVVIWVVDPEKYADAALHDRFLRPLSDYRAQFLFVLNQVDRIAEQDRARVKEDFVRLLEEIGIEAPSVVIISASPPVGPPMGLDRLLALLDPARAGIDRVETKLITDLEELAGRLVDKTGGAKPLDFEDHWGRARARAAVAFAEGEPATGFHEVTEFLDQLGSMVGGGLGREIRAKASNSIDLIEGVTTDTAASESHRASASRIAKVKDTASPAHPAVGLIKSIDSELETKLGEPLREIMRMRARANAAVTDLYLSVASLLASSAS